MQKVLQKLFITIGIIGAFFAINTTLSQTATYAIPPSIQDDNLPEEVEVPSTEDTDDEDEEEGSEDIPTSAGSVLGECRTFLGLNSWDCNIITNPDNQEQLEYNVKKIALNISDIISGIAIYLLVGFVIYGGYLYIFSSGDPAKSTSGKKTLTNAFIGLAIVTLAKIIFSSISIALTGSSNFQTCTTAGCEFDVVKNLINWFIGIAGVVSAVYVVIGSIGYITSSGDPAKLQKSRTTITYSLIGLAIVALSLTISNFVAESIDAANQGEDISGPIMSLLNTVIGFASVVSVAYAIKGGIGIMTSAGDPAKLKKSKDTILYACIGLILCALSFAIVNWAIKTIIS